MKSFPVIVIKYVDDWGLFVHSKLPEGTRCSWYCNKIVFY